MHTVGYAGSQPGDLVVLEVVACVLVGGGTIGVNPRALVRNDAIWSRRTGSWGQYRSLLGGLQPAVTPAACRALMSFSNTEPVSSMNWSIGDAG